MELMDALKSLDPTVDEHWNKSGQPNLTSLSAMTGTNVTRVKVVKLAPELVREIIEEAVSEDPPETDDSGHGLHALNAAFSALTSEEIRNNSSLQQVVSSYNHHYTTMMTMHNRNVIKGRM